MYHSYQNLDLPVSIGGYECARKPEEPIIVHMMKAACKPGLPARQQHSAGRMQLYLTTFEDMERRIRDQLRRTLGAGGFDPARDIAAITVNRWPHGYAYEYNSLFDSFWLEGGVTPCEIARKPFGRVAIANADAGAYAYTRTKPSIRRIARWERLRKRKVFPVLRSRPHLRRAVSRVVRLLRHSFRRVGIG